MKDARAVIHTDHRGGRDGIEADGGHRAESETKACSRIAVVAFSQVRWYLGTPPFGQRRWTAGVCRPYHGSRQIRRVPRSPHDAPQVSDFFPPPATRVMQPSRGKWNLRRRET